MAKDNKVSHDFTMFWQHMQEIKRALLASQTALRERGKQNHHTRRALQENGKGFLALGELFKLLTGETGEEPAPAPAPAPGHKR